MKTTRTTNVAASAFITAAIGVTGILVVPSEGLAATGTVLFSFLGGKSGDTPLAGVIEDANGNFYGTLSDERTDLPKKYFGVVYELAHRQGMWIQHTLYRFAGVNAGDGARPVSGVLLDATGAIYGATANGGSAAEFQDGAGTVFKLSPPGAGQTKSTETILYKFTGGADGNGPNGGIIFGNNGSLYGTTVGGGNISAAPPGGAGVVFELTPPSAGKTNWTESTLYTFQGGSDGVAPASTLVQDSSGAFYGTTLLGGTSCQTPGGCGTVFKLTPPTQGQSNWTEAILHSFTGGADGGTPMTNVVLDSNGNLYGTANVSASTCGCGLVFELSPPTGGQTAWTETILHTFTGSPDGQYPIGNVIMQSGGTLLVPTGGGSSDSGAVVKLVPPMSENAWREKVLFSFAGGAGGQTPVSLRQDSEGNIEGTTELGGTKGVGTFFRVHP